MPGNRAALSPAALSCCRDNFLLGQLIGLCPVLAAARSLVTGSAVAVLLAVLVTLLSAFGAATRTLLPAQTRVIAFLLVGATVVALLDRALAAFLPGISAALGVYVAVMAVNCAALDRAESCAAAPAPGRAVGGALRQALLAGLVIIAFGTLRELASTGAVLTDLDLLRPLAAAATPRWNASLFAAAPGGLLILGLMLAAINAVARRRAGARGETNGSP